MAFCPDCEAEYRAGITECPDCGVALVDKLTPENSVHDKSDHEFVLLRSFTNSAETEMVFELLDRNGIRAFVRAGDIGIFGTSFHGGSVMVDERDLARAVELYEAYFEAEHAPPPEDLEDNQ
ncbi:MAG: hypothetical protein AABO41_22220 [Acidobacteriota bacterium]